MEKYSQHITARYYTLGCKLNYAETSTIADALAERGVSKLADDVTEAPSLCVVNTCSVTGEASKKCRQLLRSLSRRYPDASIVVTGCYAQLCPDDVADIPGVAIVAGNDRKGAIAEYVDSWMADRGKRLYVTACNDLRRWSAACAHGDRTRYFLKVQDGCDYYCTYCTIPLARGRSRSGSVDELVAQARKVAADGGKEIVITGVNIGDFGKRDPEGNLIPQKDRATFFDLIRALDKVEGIERYRISSIEPNLLTDEMIEWVAASRRFMPHFHIPFQSGSDEVLRLMHRRYDTALLRHRILKIKEVMPDAFIGVDLIAGMRGESRELFEQSRDFIASLPVTRLHIFPYSERPGTKALEITPVVDQAEKHRRVAEMMKVSDEKLGAFSRSFIGTVRPVLIEHAASDGSMSGHTDNYLRVNLTESRPQLANTIARVRFTAYDPATGEMTGTIEP